MLLGNRYVEIPVRESLGEGQQIGTFTHGRGDANNALVRFSSITQPLAKDIGVLGPGWLGSYRLRLAGRHRLDLVDGMVTNGVGFSRRKTLAFGRYHMKKLGPVQLADIFQCLHQQGQVVAVNGADVVEAELFEQGPRSYHALEVFLGFACQRHQMGSALEHPLAAVPHLVIGSARQQLGEVVRQPSHVARNGHVVVIEDHQHIGVQVAGMVQCLKRHPCGHGAIADHCNALAARALHAGGDGHPQGRTDGRAGMPHAKGVVFAFSPLREARQTILAANAVHTLATTSEDFVGIGLMPDIPHQAVVGSIEHIVQSNGEFKNSKAGTKVPAGLPYGPQQECAQLPCQLSQLVLCQLTQLCGSVNPVQKRRVGPF